VTYVIAEPCIDVLDRACVDECPVDCIYEGARALYIHPDECVDCGACEPVCPVEAIFYEGDVPAPWSAFTMDNAVFFANPLPGAGTALGSPGGAAKMGRRGADTALVASYPDRAR
jgi:NAD-dependent dihydropyrimidine dehydrogenase PreA subunit